MKALWNHKPSIKPPLSNKTLAAANKPPHLSIIKGKSECNCIDTEITMHDLVKLSYHILIVHIVYNFAN